MGSKPTTARRHFRTAVLAFACLAALAAPFAGSASAAPDGLNGIGPGSPLLITRNGGTFGCTANFIWQSGSSKYLGTAGHCLTGSTRVRVCATNCVFGSTTNVGNALGLVELCGPTTAACSFPVVADNNEGNDFGLIPLSAVSAASLRREVPIFGGPNGEASVGFGSKLCMYGTGVGPGDVIATKGRVAVGISSDATTWFSHGVATPGDSAAPVSQLTTGAAIGLQTHIACAGPSGMCGTTATRARALAATQGLTITLW